MPPPPTPPDRYLITAGLRVRCCAQLLGKDACSREHLGEKGIRLRFCLVK